MRVIFLTHYFPPEVGAPQARIAALADALAARGVDVGVHTCPPHYPDGQIRPPYRNRPLAREQRGPVRVVRSAVYPAFNRGLVRRLANHASFAASALVTAPGAPRADVVVVETPPLFLAGSAIAYARLKRARLVVNVADRWPASAVELGALTQPRAIAAAEWLERRSYGAAAAITTPTRGLVDALDAVPEAHGKVVWMAPAVDLDRFQPGPPPADGGALRVLYAGTVGMAQGLDTLLDAAERLGPDKLRLTIAGGGAEAPGLAQRAEALPGVEMAGIVPFEAVPGLYALHDAAVVLLRDRPIFRDALPTKLLEGLAAGRPVVVSAAGEAAELVRDARAGLAVPPENPAELAAAFELLRRDPSTRERMGAAGRRLAEADYGRAAAADRWERLLKTLK